MLMVYVYLELGRTKIFSRRRWRRFNLEFDAPILAGQVFGDAPIKKAAHRHVIPIGGLSVKSVQPTLVKSLNVGFGHAVGCRFSAERGEHSECVNLRLRRAPGPAFPCAAFTRESFRVNEPLHAILQQQTGRDLWRMPNLRCLSDCDR